MIEKIPCEYCCWIYKAPIGSITWVQCSECGLFCNPQSEKSRDLVKQLKSCIEHAIETTPKIQGRQNFLTIIWENSQDINLGLKALKEKKSIPWEKVKKKLRL